MENKKQTAVEWLVNELEKEAITDYTFAKSHKVITLDVYMFNKLFEQAKQMEKEQIINAHIDGYESISGQSENYYNETYGK